jgi:hypothetical protein
METFGLWLQLPQQEISHPGSIQAEQPMAVFKNYASCKATYP